MVFLAVGGIRPNIEEPGYRNFFINPQIPNGVTWSESTKETPYGKIIFNWREKENTLEEHMSIPSGTTATIIIPDNYARVVNDGKMSDISDSTITMSAGTHVIEFNK